MSTDPAPTAPDGSDATDPNADVASLSYEQARDELVSVVTSLEQGTATLEQSLALWERGTALADRCEEWLTGAKRRLDAALASESAASATTDSGGDPAASGALHG